MKAKWLILFFCLFAGFGYLREFFFVHYNILMYEVYYHSASPVPAPAAMNIFRSFSYDTLYYSKYIYTFISVVLFLALNYFAVKKLTAQPFLLRLLLYIYTGIFFLAFISMAYGYLINHRLQDDEYTLSRWLLGIAQSPIICLILVASEKLYNKSFKS